MGLASGKTVRMFGKDFQSNKPDPLLYMAGASGSLVWNKTWAISYQGEAGVSYPKIILSNTEPDSSTGQPSQNTITIDTNIFRTDHSLALSRTLGTSGFSIFVGAKVQAFSYSQSNANYVGISSAGTQNFQFSLKQSMLSYGPAAGLSYTFRPLKKIFASLQGGFIYFPGKYTASILTQNGNANDARETYYGLGFTALASVSVPLSDELFLQLAARGQYYRIKTVEAFAKNGNQPETGVSGTLDNVQDILLGMQVAVIYRIF
jgi:hypothetical protein